MLVTLSMKNSIIILVLSLFSFQAVAQKSPSEELFDAAMNRIVPAEKFVWNWRDAVLLKAFTDIYRAEPQKREAIADYVDEAMTRLAPRAHGVHPNGVASAVGLAFLQEIGRSSMETDKTLEKVLMQYPHLTIYPALTISILMIAFNLFGNGLRDALDPTQRGLE